MLFDKWVAAVQASFRYLIDLRDAVMWSTLSCVSVWILFMIHILYLSRSKAEDASYQCLSPLPLPMQLLKDYSVTSNFMAFLLCHWILMTVKDILRQENSFWHGQKGKVWLLTISSLRMVFAKSFKIQPEIWAFGLPARCASLKYELIWKCSPLAVFFYICVIQNVATCHFCVQTQHADWTRPKYMRLRL